MTLERPHRWPLWRRQLTVLVRQEVKRTLFSRRALLVYVLVAMPLAVAVLRALFIPDNLLTEVAHTTRDFAEMYRIFMLRFVVFFGCAGFFIQAFRGEILDHSLHYLMLAPVRREVLILGKYLGALVTALAVFLPATTVIFVLFYLPHGVSACSSFLFSGGGLGHLISYLAIITLASMGWGAVFLLLGILVRNPMVPTMVILAWESWVAGLPPLLKFFSITHHLTALYPVPLTHGPFALLSNSTPAPLAVLGLLVVCGLILALASLRARRMEITYAAD
jgi:ABC-type transport system involved in multi-copper enzyme maturation permease subunit